MRKLTSATCTNTFRIILGVSPQSCPFSEACQEHRGDKAGERRGAENWRKDSSETAYAQTI